MFIESNYKTLQQVLEEGRENLRQLEKSIKEIHESIRTNHE